MGVKGSWRRPENYDRVAKNHDRIFGKNPCRRCKYIDSDKCDNCKFNGDKE